MAFYSSALAAELLRNPIRPHPFRRTCPWNCCRSLENEAAYYSLPPRMFSPLVSDAGGSVENFRVAELLAANPKVNTPPSQIFYATYTGLES